MQLTCSSTHDSIVEPYYTMLHHLKPLGIAVGMVEVWFVVPDCRLEEFRSLKNDLWFENQVVEKHFSDARKRHSMDGTQQDTESPVFLLPMSVEIRIHVACVQYPIDNRKPEAGISASILDPVAALNNLRELHT